MRKRRITEYQITAINADSPEVLELISQAHAKAVGLLGQQLPTLDEAKESEEEDLDNPISA
jgi:hypothetical protein